MCGWVGVGVTGGGDGGMKGWGMEGLLQVVMDVEARALESTHKHVLFPPPTGTLDQGNGTLEIFEEPPPDVIYPAALDTFGNMGRVIDNLFARSQKIIT